MIKRTAQIILALTLTACGHLSVTREDQRPSEAKEYSQYAFAYGFIPGSQLPSESALCLDGRIERLDFKMSPVDVLITAATFGLLVSHRVTVACSGRVNKN